MYLKDYIKKKIKRLMKYRKGNKPNQTAHGKGFQDDLGLVIR